jgi:hypothetical protein
MFKANQTGPGIKIKNYRFGTGNQPPRRKAFTRTLIKIILPYSAKSKLKRMNYIL